MNEDTKQALLASMLEVAVPSWVRRLQMMPWSDVTRRAEACVEVVASRGDLILYRSKKNGETAKAFNALAEAVEILSFAPGGIDLFGVHFEHSHPEAH